MSNFMKIFWFSMVSLMAGGGLQKCSYIILKQSQFLYVAQITPNIWQHVKKGLDQRGGTEQQMILDVKNGVKDR